MKSRSVVSRCLLVLVALLWALTLSASVPEEPFELGNECTENHNYERVWTITNPNNHLYTAVAWCIHLNVAENGYAWGGTSGVVSFCSDEVPGSPGTKLVLKPNETIEMATPSAPALYLPFAGSVYFELYVSGVGPCSDSERRNICYNEHRLISADGPNECGCDLDIVDLGCGCGEPGPGECGCNDEEDLGCGCGEPGPSECGCDSSVVDLGCGCGEPAPGECGCSDLEISGCDKECGSTKEFDECGVCDGDGSSCECVENKSVTTNKVNKKAKRRLKKDLKVLVERTEYFADRAEKCGSNAANKTLKKVNRLYDKTKDIVSEGWSSTLVISSFDSNCAGSESSCIMASRTTEKKKVKRLSKKIGDLAKTAKIQSIDACNTEHKGSASGKRSDDYTDDAVASAKGLPGEEQEC